MTSLNFIYPFSLLINAERHLNADGVDESEIVDINDEYINDPEFKHVKSGIIRAKLKFNAAKNFKHFEIVQKLPKKTLIDEIPVVVERKGEPRCRFCFSTEHKISESKTKNLRCDKCKRSVHTALECNLAKRISKQNEDYLFDEEDSMDNIDDYDHENQKIENERTIDLPEKKQGNNPSIFAPEYLLNSTEISKLPTQEI
ncbi:unnamed protein product [Brachionus calyciflorus]|uniref:Uncharacterized protein n=1 Tax=Brachionus calyciflorus TaxID=104777 RepID=A0A814IUW9_9BILA|nr:unnamed protein product [Brachionus calyciflorus]